MIAVCPASGGIRKGNKIIKVDMGYGKGITHSDIQSGCGELVSIGNRDRDSLFDILQEVTQYPDRQITCCQTIIVSEIGIELSASSYISNLTVKYLRSYT